MKRNSLDLDGTIVGNWDPGGLTHGAPEDFQKRLGSRGAIQNRRGLMHSQSSPEFQRRVETLLTQWRLPKETVDELTSHHIPVNYEKGSVIFLQGSPSDIFFCVFKGLVRVYAPQPDGERTLFMLAGPGDFIGTVNSVDSKGRLVQAFEANAITRCSAGLLTRGHLTKILQTLSPPLLIQMLEDLNTNWCKTVQWYTNFLGLSLRQRFELVLRDLGARFGIADRCGTLLALELGHEDYAEMIGCSRPMVSRLIAEMTGQGLIEQRQRHSIVLCKGSGLETPPIAAASMNGNGLSRTEKENLRMLKSTQAA
jgi:CRP/FNR family transcriptional regulator